MQLFFDASINESSTSFIFSKEESKHIVKVLRKKETDILFVTNGFGAIFKTEITLATEQKCTVSILSCEKQPPPPYYLHLAVAPTKMNDRYEWFLEKATEIGIQEITPIICHHSERKVVKTERFDKIILSAIKQSNQAYLPILNPPVSFKEFIARKQEGQKFIAHCEERVKKSLKSIVKANEQVTVLIGPEGDFSSKEIELAQKNNYIAVSLGQTRLRTETAALVACHSIAFINED